MPMPWMREVVEGHRQGPVLFWLKWGLALAAAVGLTLGSYRYPENAIIPTLAFVTWAYLFARAAIRVPGLLGLFPDPVEEDEPMADPGPDGLDSTTDPSAIYRIDE